MKVQERQGKTLAYLVLEPDGYDPGRQYPMVILLHGFGAHMGDLAGLCPAINSWGYVYVCPNAPLSLEIGPGMVGFAWMPRGSNDLEDLGGAEEKLATLFEDVMAEYQVAPGQVVLGGFSQGGMMTYWCGLIDPDLFAGLAVLSGRVPNPEELKARLPARRAQPVFVSHGTDDILIPVEDARQSRRFLTSQGYQPQYREYPMGHQITQAVLQDLVPWLQGVLPPLPPEA